MVDNHKSMPHLSTMEWDYKDNFKSAGLGGGGAVYYVYDANGERVRKIVEKQGGIVEERLYLGGYEVYTKTTNGTLEEERETIFVEDGTKKIAQIDDAGTTRTVRYQYDNHLGSASLELDENAGIISYEEYRPFGTTSYRSGRSETEVSLKRYKYVGKERDEETGLYYYGARYYADWIGRFVSVDPLVMKYPDFSPYVYGNDDPIRYYDPSGMQSEDEVDQIHSNFFIKKGDKQAKIDIKTLPDSNHQKYVKFTDEGGVYLDFGKKEMKKEKLLAKDSGLKLIYDLQHAKYKDEEGKYNDAKILYQTEEPFDFSGWKEPVNDKIPNSFYKHKPGENAVEKNGNYLIARPFSCNTSVTTYGTNLKLEPQNTLLPKKGFQGQVVIAPGTPTIFLGYRKVDRIEGDKHLTGEEPV